MLKKRQKHPFAAVLFDLDGTLLDTAHDLAYALNTLLERHNRPKLAFEKIRPQASSGTPGLLGIGFNIDPTHPSYAVLRLELFDIYHRHIDNNTAVFPGMFKLLKYIESHKIPWGIVTNKPSFLAKQLLDCFDLTERCACLVGADDVKNRKPDPEGLLIACKQLNVAPENCLYIGDAERDIIAAKKANMPSVVALYGYIPDGEDAKQWQADYYINTCYEIQALL